MAQAPDQTEQIWHDVLEILGDDEALMDNVMSKLFSADMLKGVTEDQYDAWTDREKEHCASCGRTLESRESEDTDLCVDCLEEVKNS